MIRSQSLRVLGLPAGSSEADIRRAYAQKLRVTNPEDNPEGFKELRAAYEDALREARYRAEYPEHFQDEDDETAEDSDGAAANAATIEGVEWGSEGAVAEIARRFAERIYSGDDQAGADLRAPMDGGDRPTDPSDVEAERFHRQSAPPPDPGLNADEQAHADVCNALAAALHANAPPQELKAALEAVLKSPGLEHLDTYNRTEQWLIQVLASMRPASHVLFERAIDHFHWNRHEGDHRARGPAFIIALRNRIPGEKAAAEFLERVKKPKHEFHRAYKELSKPPRERSGFSKFLALFRYDLVERFLIYIDKRVPLAAEGLDPEAGHWWRGLKRGSSRWALAAVSFVQSFSIFGVVGLALLFFAYTYIDNGAAPSSPVPPSERPIDMIAAISNLAEKMAEENDPALSIPEPERKPAGTRMVLTEFGKRVKSRTDCIDAAKRLGGAGPGRTQAAADARKACDAELKKAPDSLVVAQQAAMAALAAGDAAEGQAAFDAILKVSPNDPYALYGAGLAAVMADPATDTALMAEALKREPKVRAYFEGFGFTPPDVAPMGGEPASRVVKRPNKKKDGELKEVGGMENDGVQALYDHFGVQKMPKGKATLECLIKSDGRMTECLISKEEPYNIGVGEFALPIVEAVRFEPMTLNGAPVDDLPISYTLSLGKDTAEPKESAPKDDAAAPPAN